MKDWFNVSPKVFYLTVKVKNNKREDKRRKFKNFGRLPIHWYLFIDTLRKVKLNMGFLV